MGDLSTEPSMEDILSSIKRIIAEEGDGAPVRPRRQPRPLAVAPLAPSLAVPPLADDEADDGPDHREVLELSDPMPAARPDMARPELARPEPEVRTARPAAAPAAPEPATATPIVSDTVAAASRGALDSLSRIMVKPEPGSDGTLEGLVRDMLRPMLRDWLDANLPDMVEGMVQREIKRITGAA